MRIGRGRTRIGVLLVLIGLFTLAAPAHAGSQSGRPVWYVSLGDSLSRGVQPDQGGVNHPTDHGYSDKLYLALKASKYPDLKLQKFGCPVTETTVTMLKGDGTCSYSPFRSQLAAAVDFLRRNRSSVALVTIDIGANDIEPCGSFEGIDDECVKKAFLSVSAHLPPILAALRLAAGPNVPIVGMNYYNPFLPVWLTGPEGQEIAQDSAEKLAAFNGLLGAIYRFFRMPVADVAATFQADNFDIIPLGIPLNVALTCEFTFMCVSAPIGPNIHATDSGYDAVTGAFLNTLP